MKNNLRKAALCEMIVLGIYALGIAAAYMHNSATGMISPRTDGAQLCYRGLPCPNLCTGGFAFHGPFEHIAAEDMELCARMLEELICLPRK